MGLVRASRKQTVCEEGCKDLKYSTVIGVLRECVICGNAAPQLRPMLANAQGSGGRRLQY